MSSMLGMTTPLAVKARSESARKSTLPRRPSVALILRITNSRQMMTSMRHSSSLIPAPTSMKMLRNWFIGEDYYIDASIVTSPVETDDMDLTPEEEDDVSNGFLYEVPIDVGDAADEAEDDGLNLVITLTIVAYDIAGNRASKTTTITVDTIEPELIAAFTGVERQLR